MSIQVQELDCQEGMIGLITLNSPQTLNALSEPMFDDMQAALERWGQDSRVCLVLLEGAGERAFCAGGNIRELHAAMTGGSDSEAPSRFFTKEYRLNYTLHCFPKPVVAIGHGVIMGGGLGLLSGARYRLLTADATIAMPEITIGLFPDVGSSWFLNRLPGRLGLFMGLTGARLNSADALRVGLADMAITSGAREALLANIRAQRWSGVAASDDNRLFRLLHQAEATDYRALPESQLARHEQTIARLIAGKNLPEIVDRLTDSELDTPWWQSAIGNLASGCPVSAWLIWNQLRRGRQMSLRDIFRMELAMAMECTRRPDLPEGIRARLIDKDQAPQWSFNSVRDVPEEVIEAHFQPVWTDADDPMGLL